MSLIRKITDAAARTARLARRVACMYGLGGPVGVIYAARLALIKRRQAELAELITREKELNRTNLQQLNWELTQSVLHQQSVSQAAAEFWLACEKAAK